MTIQILSSETHVYIAVINSEGEIVTWQFQPFFTLAELYPARVKCMLNRTSTTRPDAEETLRNVRVFTGVVYLRLSETDEQMIQDGNTTLIDSLMTVNYPDGSSETFILNSLWSSATKNKTLTGYTQDLNRSLRKVFNYAEAGVRVGRATRGGFSNGRVAAWPIQWLPMGTNLVFGPDVEKPIGDGEFIIRQSDAVGLRRALVCKPFSLEQWRLSTQIVSQVKHPDDKEGVLLELLPHVAEGIERINDHSEFIAHAFKFGMKDESRERLLELSEVMFDHPDLNLSLSPDKARAIFDTITTGKPKSVQGFVAIAGPRDGCAYFPSKQTRLLKSELALLARYPVNNSRCIMPVVAIHEGPISDFLSEIEQFQGTLFGKDDDGAGFMAAGQFIVVPDDRWPAEHAQARLLACSKNIKAFSTWKSGDDVKATQSGEWLMLFTGFISVCQWAHMLNGAMVDPDVFKEANGDFDFDQFEAIPEEPFPLTYNAFLNEWLHTTGLAVSKLPKLYTFDDLKAPRSKTLTDTLAGAMAVGLAANINLLILNADPRTWSDLATRIGTDDYFYAQMVAKGYIVEDYPAEMVEWMMEICECDDEAARRVIRMFYVLSFFIQCGVDGFKTNLDNIGGMKALVKEIGRIWKILTDEGLVSTRLIAFNPKKSPAALRDRDHLPEFSQAEPTFGISESLMKMAIEGFAWDGLLYRLELPEYLYLGALPDSFKFFAIGPRTQEELEACRLLRRICRDELARRSMMTPSDWAIFAATFWTPLLKDFQQNGRVILRYDRKISEAGKPVYTIAKERRFPTLTGISWERIAHLLWFAFHDTGGKGAGSAIPLFWAEPLREHLFDLLEHQPGRLDLKDDFQQVVVGVDRAGIERNVTHVVDVRIEQVEELIVIGQDENGQDITLTAQRSRNTIEFPDGRYLMFPKDGPLLGGARFNLTIERDGSRDIGHFVRAISVTGLDLAARLESLKAQFERH
ncbi:MAG: hypothetical protein HS126_19000 [Anaerolineales bacterium]|nr:hypothetical protein [Anaerolineales bacterium]